MDPECVNTTHSYLKELWNREWTEGGSASAVFAFFTALTNPDDPASSASQTFMHARLLSQQKVHLDILKFFQFDADHVHRSHISPSLMTEMPDVW